MIIFVLVILACLSDIGNAFNFDYEPPDSRVYEIKQRTQEDEPVAPESVAPEPVARVPVAREPIVPERIVQETIQLLSTTDLPSSNEAMNEAKDVEASVNAARLNSMCDDFLRYSTKCTVSASRLYNSTRKRPPPPKKVHDWCKAIRQLTNCAIDWNTDCAELNDNRFDEDSIRGHKYVLENFCDDEWFVSQYTSLSQCIEDAANGWENCYLTFKKIMDQYKNSTKELTHYETHFNLCCARTRFRHCTLEVLFASKQCIHEEVLIVQKFSAIVSEGDLFQNCDFNMVYSNCSGGDPRPDTELLTKLVAPEDSGAAKRAAQMLILSLALLILCCR